MTAYQRICFDAEDNPPPSYYSKDDDDTDDDRPSPPELPQVHTSKKIDPQEWLKAPEFIPRSKQQVLQQDKNPVQQFDLPPPEDYGDYKAEEFSAHDGNEMPPSFLPMPMPMFGRPPLGPMFDPSAAAMFAPHPGLLPPPLGVAFGGLPRLPMSFVPRPPAFRIPLKPAFPQYIGGRMPLRPQLGQFNQLIRPGAVPPGYTANITSINSGNGPPIHAIVLKKKRKKRNRRQKTKLDDEDPSDPNNSTSAGAGSSKESTPTYEDVSTTDMASSEPDLSKMPQLPSEAVEEAFGRIDQAAVMGGSCPDLSDAQRELWDEFLFAAAVDDPNMRQTGGVVNAHQKEEFSSITSPLPLNNEYEVCGRAVMSALESAVTTDKISSPAVRAIDRQLRQQMGVKMDDSFIDSATGGGRDQSRESSAAEERVFDRLLKDSETSKRRSNAARTPKSIFDEMEDRENFERAQLHARSTAIVQAPNDSRVSSVLVGRDMLLDGNRLFCGSGYVENRSDDGMRITVNAFEDPEELTLSDNDDPAPSRFQMIHSALKRNLNSQQYGRLNPPDRTCCSLM
uniref:Uncharacterized protein n=1 Tax=Plectus sambesii TaxID=2011161 RepID=A0A914XKA2_9BILA